LLPAIVVNYHAYKPDNNKCKHKGNKVADDEECGEVADLMFYRRYLLFYNWLEQAVSFPDE
jgi:hypothetical protein